MAIMLALRPISYKDACAYVLAYHRHHSFPQGHKYSIGAAVLGELVGVVMVGRPVARRLQDGYTVEVTRLCTNGTYNACSFLYGAASRAARATRATRACALRWRAPTRAVAALRACAAGRCGSMVMGTIVADHPGPWRSAEMDLAPCGFGAARIMIKSGSSAIPISAISYKNNS